MTVRDRAIEAGNSLLHAIMLDNGVMKRVADTVTAEKFFLPAQQFVFQAMGRLVESGQGVDPVTLANALDQAGKLQAAGGIETIAKITGDFALASNSEEYARSVEQGWILHQLAEVGWEVYNTVTKGTVEDPQEFVSNTRARIADISNGIGDRDTLHHAADISAGVLEELFSDDPTPPSIPTGMSKFDSEFGGIYPTYVVVGGYPGWGKSSFLANLAFNFALSGRRVLYMSMEDSRHVIIERAISRFANVLSTRIRSRKLQGDDYPLVLKAAEMVKALPLMIDDKGGRSGTEVRGAVLRHIDKEGADIVLFDHLGKIREKGPIYERTTLASNAMADLQKEIGIPFIAACQLSRQENKNQIQLPGLFNLRDSGHIEADARQVILLPRPHYYFQMKMIDEEPDIHELAAIVAKSNYGPTGMINLWCDLAYSYVGDPRVREPAPYVFKGEPRANDY